MPTQRHALFALTVSLVALWLLILAEPVVRLLAALRPLEPFGSTVRGY